MVKIPTYRNTADGVSVPALKKGLTALEAVAKAGKPMRLTDISRTCGRSVAEMQRVVPCLEQCGYLVRDAVGGYRLSDKLFRLGNFHPPFQDLISRAMPAMRSFAQHTGQSVHICVLSETSLVLLADVPGTGYAQLSVRAGSIHDPVSTVSGRLLLAFAPKFQCDFILARRVRSRAARSKLAQRLDLIRVRGYEYARSHLFKGVHDLAVPVISGDQAAMAAIACTWLAPRQGTGASALRRILTELNRCAGIMDGASPQDRDDVA